MKRKENILSFIYIAGITVIVALAFAIMWNVSYDRYNYFNKGNYVLIFVYIALFEILMYFTDGYQFLVSRLRVRVINQSLITILTNIIFYIVICLIAKNIVDPIPVILETIAVILCLIVWVVVMRNIINKVLPAQNWIYVYTDNDDLKVYESFIKHKQRFNITKIYHLDSDDSDNINEKILDNYDGVLIGSINHNVRSSIVKYCYKKHIQTLIVPSITDIIIRYGKDFRLIDTPIISLSNNKISVVEAVIKRFFSILLSLIALILFSPIFLVIIIAIKIDDHGPVFYKQKRLTKGKREFIIYKFRTMIVNAEAEGVNRYATQGDDRITRVGKFMRATRLDELPQLFNILKGDMAIVGPRPERPEICQQYEKKLPEFAYRTEVKAGLTGLAQTQGKYNTTPYDKLRLDLLYINSYSLLLDAKIILQTISILFISESTEGVEEGKLTAGD